MKTNIIILFILIAVTACKPRSKLNSDEQSLSNQILSEEEQLAYEAAQRAEQEKQLADSIAKLAKGFQFKEDRSIDVQNLPDIIKISSATEEGVELYLSDIVETVEYFVLEQLPDTSILAKTRLNAKISGKKLIVYGLSGLYVYDRSGKLSHPVVKNDIDNLDIRLTPGNSGFQTRFSSGNVYYYGQIGEVSILGNELFFTTLDKQNNQYEFRKIDINKKPLLNTSYDIEKGPGKFPGEKLLGLKEDQVGGGFVSRFQQASTTKPIGNGFYINTPTLLGTSSNHDKVVILNTNNDTICQFTNFDKIRNFTSSLMSRALTPIGNYTFNGHTYLFTTLNDTIFKVIIPNQFVPAYIFDFGDKKISANEYFAPGATSKFYCEDIKETLEKLFIRYNTLDGSSRIGIYYKKTKKFRPIINTSEEGNIIDNINGLYGYWPEYLNEKREDCRIYSGLTLKLALKDNSLQSINTGNRQKFEQFVNNLSDEALVAVIYKLKP